MTAETARYMIGRYAVNGILAIVVIGLVASIVSPWVPPQTWATIDEKSLHIEWDPQKHTVRYSVEVTKHQECRRVLVSNVLRPVERDTVEDRSIELKGALREKLEAMPAGTTEAKFDEATPADAIRPGHYLMTLVAYCELPLPEPAPAASPAAIPPTPTTLATEPVRAVVVVYDPGPRRGGMAAVRNRIARGAP